jgi:hypothetical protein
MYARTSEGWEVQKFTKTNEMILLPVLEASLSVKEMYEL